MHIRESLFAAATLFVVAPAPVEELNAVYESGTTIVYSETTTTETIVEDVKMMIGDQELPRRAADSMKADIEEAEEVTIEFATEVLESKDGVPTKIRRTFETIEQSTSTAVEDTELTGVLAGRTIIVESSDGEVTAEIDDDGDEVEESYLEDHRLEYDADGLLPEESVEVGDTWTLPREVNEKLAGLQSIQLFDDEDEDGEDKFDDEFDAQVLENGTFEGSAKLAEIEEHEGLRCARITFEIKMSADIDDPAFFDEAEEEMPDEADASVSISMEVEGTLWFALAERRCVEFKSESTGEMFVELGLADERFSMEMEFTLGLSGTAQGKWSVKTE